MAKQKNIILTNEDITARGNALLQHLRNNAIWQYVPWFVANNSKWKGDASLQHRMRMIFNGKSTPLDTNLLLDMEKIAAKHLPNV